MFICVCKGLDEKSLREMSKKGVDTLSKVVKSCGAGGDCGTCAFKINRVLKDMKKEEAAPLLVEPPRKVSNN